ncbi:MAG: hypothetical protein ACKERG_02290 [Candidatus Hodgkinia cicadicola]
MDGRRVRRGVWVGRQVRRWRTAGGKRSRGEREEWKVAAVAFVSKLPSYIELLVYDASRGKIERFVCISRSPFY